MRGVAERTRMITTPVAFFIYNRPDVTRQVFSVLRQIRPVKLFVVADGPRLDKPGDKELCRQTRAVIEGVDWPCNVETKFADTNLGCKQRVSTGLDWVFSQAPEAIILEDDCLPHPTFFRYCEELLEYYREDERVMMVSGFNPQTCSDSEQFSYFFSRYPHIWGWASWRRAWKHYDVNMSRWPDLRDTSPDFFFAHTVNERKYWIDWFDAVYQGKVDTWDAQVSFMFFCQNGLAVFPNVNLISNIGFGADATHTKVDNGVAGVGTLELVFPFEHPPTVQIDVSKDNERRKREYTQMGMCQKLFQLVVRIFRGSTQ